MMMSTEANQVGAPAIQSMFARIAKHYDFLNHFLSLNRDKVWRRRAVKASEVKAGDQVLDVCTGTGDLAFEFLRKTKNVVGLDFCAPMLQEARKKGTCSLAVGDSVHLPVPDQSFDITSVAFGIRNVVDFEKGLREMFRILKPGGRIVVLEFTSPPAGVFAVLYNFYFQKILPKLAALFSEKSAYSYLPKSVSVFPNAPEFSKRLEDVGFKNVTYDYLTLGIVGLHVGTKP